MKKSVSLFLCILCCLFPLSACAQPEKRIEDQMNLALEQLDRPMGEAFEALDLPGSPVSYTHLRAHETDS